MPSPTSARSSLPWWASVILIAVGVPIYQAPAIWKYLRGAATTAELIPLQYLRHRNSELGPAIIEMAYKSAWGRWFAAQHLVSVGTPIDMLQLLNVASFKVIEKIVDGTLEIRGRLPIEMDYEQIPQTHWRSSVLHFIKDPISLWKLIIIPRGGVEIDSDGMIEATDAVAHRRSTLLANYDSLIVDASQIEKLWPAQDAFADKKRRKLLRQARWRDLNKDEIQRLS